MDKTEKCNLDTTEEEMANNIPEMYIFQDSVDSYSSFKEDSMSKFSSAEVDADTYEDMYLTKHRNHGNIESHIQHEEFQNNFKFTELNDKSLLDAEQMSKDNSKSSDVGDLANRSNYEGMNLSKQLSDVQEQARYDECIGFTKDRNMYSNDETFHRNFKLTENWSKTLLNAGQIFACYKCNKILPWSEVSIRNIRPYLEGQTYMCNKCDLRKLESESRSLDLLNSSQSFNKSTHDLLNSSQSFNKSTHDLLNSSQSFDKNALEKAVMESVAAKGISLLPVNPVPRQVTQSPSCSGENSSQNLDNSNKRRYECNLCGFKFKRNGHLQRHMRIHNTDIPVFKCDKCERSYRDSYNLLRHKKVHEVPSADLPENPPYLKPFFCGICEKRFRDNHDLQRHVRVHTGELPYACSLCDKHFIDNRTLKLHIRQHKSEKLFVCPVCGKKFYEQRIATKHMTKTFKNLPHYRCEVCDKVFREKDSYDDHTKNICEKYMDYAFHCEECDKGFKFEKSLKSHMKKQHKVKSDESADIEMGNVNFINAEMEDDEPEELDNGYDHDHDDEDEHLPLDV